MLFKKKTKIKPLFKQLIKLRENVQNRTKLLIFKHKKWEKLIQYYTKKLKRYKKFKPQDQTKYTVSKFPNKGTSYKKLYRNYLNCGRRFRLFYGGLLKKELKKQIKYFKSTRNIKLAHKNLLFLALFESRLDTVLFRSKFSKSFRNARQLITHSKVLVNQKILKSPSYTLKVGDIVTINVNSHLSVEKNLKYCLKKTLLNTYAGLWPLPPKHLIINYKTLEIFFTNIDPTNFSTDFSFNLNLEKILLNYSRN